MNWVPGRKRLVVVGFLVSLVFVLVGMTGDVSDAQEKYPSRPIQWVITSSAGGVQDLTSRIFAEELSKVLQVPIAPENKPGADQIVGIMYALSAKKDGYTVVSASESGTLISHYILPDVPFVTLRDLVPVALIGEAPTILTVRKESPFKSLEELIDHAKKNPGKVSYASAGTGTDVHLVAEQLAKNAGVKFSHVPFKGGGESIPAVLGGHTDFGSFIIGSVASHLKAGTLRGLVVGFEKRLAGFPDIPTYAEKGFPQQYIRWFSCLWVPAGTPQSVIDVLVPACEKVSKSKDFIRRMEDIDVSVGFKKPADLLSFIKEQDQMIAGVVKQVGIKPAKKK